MPIIKKIKLKEGIIGLWLLSESTDDFNGLIPENSSDKQLYDRITFEKRKVEFLSTRALLAGLLGHYPEIRYQSDGRPYLPEEKWELSISHSRTMVAVILHQNPVGIDVEIEGRDIKNIAGKFMSTDELNNISGSPEFDRFLLLHWCAKEAVFKYTKHEGINFRSQICIEQFDFSQRGQITAILKKENQEKLELFYIFCENNAIVWCYQS